MKVSPSPKKRKMTAEPHNITGASVQARFCRALTELQITGLLRIPSKKRPDFVQRVAFMKPTLEDVQHIYELHERKHGLRGILKSIDCMHWEWIKCPKALHGQFKRKDKRYPTIMLEAVADQQLWFWHAYFRVPGENKDLNVLYDSPLLDDLLADKAPETPFQVNGKTYEKCYYLADEIYPQWSTFVKAFSIARDQKAM
ncbi:ALP1-like protein [Tanacetum coccineum]